MVVDLAEKFLVEGDGNATLLLAHGAGAPMDSVFMNELSNALSNLGVRVMRFEFPYMALRREDGRKRPPNNQRQLLASWWEHIQLARDLLGSGPLFIGGKSMGGRMASMAATDPAVAAKEVRGCLCFGYPFHPPGKPDNWRIDHFSDVQVPLWIAQGERDPFGRYDEVVRRLPASSSLAVHRVVDGDHDFRPTKRSGLDPATILGGAAKAAADFMRVHSTSR